MNQKIAQNLKKVRDQINKKKEPNQRVILVAVTKTRSPEQISTAIGAGIVSIGENRVQEAELKFPKITQINSVEKRLIGQLQSNKIKKAIRLFDTIDSVDSTRLAKKISNAASTIKKIQRVLIQINTSEEKTKGGFKSCDIEEMLLCFKHNNIKIDGLMTIGPTKPDHNKRKRAFNSLKELFTKINRRLPQDKKMTEISMGMSGDFELGVESGSTMVRVGTAIFGKRETDARP
ncbi:YggS family pyridoxal phosphate-dependent enzyme [Candidatus Marinimicrobia bacterium]|jgi:pyridoxal phosphate enzyme (YggS family)|nr:YggS family pyridoxal phosphate-dependent enzyme [Candidatus Neomarinimicrobiota bacterium]MDA7685800.1 YggS family pyridoxal phosphate-dependent enzyme [Candidatus Neomarinimicrobiota bacterium]MDB3887453.1 YggS family pyridoxal phosphate-dependent enzyme [Candidatus Neomarinimicrobiota bacterium]MDB3980268.1 YggS family pyridoxal phosphate-dependent enzyme [Candidatus Neomarinimicrobiota bacterium]MDC0521560.1 YggS family pyridoxal phosphate-dependent enzyme [Candidatus Neomarinimicrobiota|tara:strand:- start:151 stop:849 length:699 start_codon:yes stop_codon:yes gene_type:complete